MCSKSSIRDSASYNYLHIEQWLRNPQKCAHYKLGADHMPKIEVSLNVGLQIIFYEFVAAKKNIII